MIGQPLKQMRVGGGNPQVMQLHLRLGPGEGGRALERHRVEVFIGESEQCLPRWRGHGPEGETGIGPRSNPHPPAQAEDRVEHRTGRVGQRPAVADRGWCADGLTTTQETGAIGLELYLAGGFALYHHQMGGPDLGIGGGTAAAGGDQRAQTRLERGFHEQLAERRMSHVVRLSRQGKLGEGRYLDLDVHRAMIDDRDAAHLGVVLRGHRDVQRRADRAVGARDVGAILGEHHFVCIRLHAGGLVAGRPYGAIAEVAEEDVGAPIVAGRILAPAGE